MKMAFVSLVIASGLFAGGALGQSAYPGFTPVEAKSGQSCGGFKKGCDDWCASGRAADPPECKATCEKQMAQCLKSGEWPYVGDHRVVQGLPTDGSKKP